MNSGWNSDPEGVGGGEFMFMPHWQTFLINVIKGCFHEEKKIIIEFGKIKYELEGGGVKVFICSRGGC